VGELGPAKGRCGRGGGSRDTRVESGEGAKREEEHTTVWDKRIMRLLTILYVVGGAAALLAPESMGRFGRWVSDNPLYMRIDGMVGIALGAWLALRQYREVEPPRPWWRRMLEG
jgi:hypothetical protein